MKYELTILILWLIAILATVTLMGNDRPFNYLGPVYAVCLIGSVITVRIARRGSPK